jgi:hypothetical protein
MAVAETEISSDHDHARVQLLDQRVRNELFRTPAGDIGVELQNDGYVDSELAEKLQTPRGAGQKFRCAPGSNYRQRMRVKGQRDALPSSPAGAFGGCFENALVAPEHTVEISDRDGGAGKVRGNAV